MSYKILKPNGILDGPCANELRFEITTLIDSGEKIIVLDFASVTFVNSSAIGALVATFKIVVFSQGELYICAMNDQVRLIFEITKMDQIFNIYETLEELENKFSLVV